MAEEKKTKTTAKKASTGTKKVAEKKTTTSAKKTTTKKTPTKKTTTTKKVTTTKKTTTSKAPVKKQTRPIEENSTSIVEKKVVKQENDFTEASEKTKCLAYALIFILLAVVVLLLAVE